MNVQERSYGGTQFRSRPIVHMSPEHHLLLIVTPWGDRDAGSTCIEAIEGHFLSAIQDMESTSPFGKMEALSEAANYLRVAIMLANDAIYQRHNRDEFVVGAEILALHFSPEEVVWTQVGQPSLLLSRSGCRHLNVLSSQFDLAWNYSTGVKHLAPLPNQMLGLYRQSNISLQSFRPQKDDRLFFISRSDFPGSFLALSESDRDLDQMSKVLSTDNADKPFWLGELKIEPL